MRYLLYLLGSIALTLTVYAYPNNPPSGYAGDPPDYDSCVNCHDSYALNSGDGYLRITGLPPAGYQSGVTYNLSVVLADPGQIRWGFEVTAIVEDGPNYIQGGNLIVTDPSHTSLATGSGNAPDYIRQTSDGTYTGTSGPVSWDFDWTAPDTSLGTVTFYASGAACNDGSGTNGDYCYTTSTPTQPEIPSGVVPDIQQSPVQFRLRPAHPNPFNPTTLISYQLPTTSFVSLSVYDISGNKVAELVNGWYNGGSYNVTFNAAGLPSGVYVYQLQAGEYRAAGKMVLMR